MKLRLVHIVSAWLILSISTFCSEAQTLRNARVIAEKANLRETPSIVGLAEGEVPEGAIVKVLDEKLPWYVVRVGDRVGWMHGATLQFEESEQRSPSTSYSQTEAPIMSPTRNSPKLPKSNYYIRGPRGGCYYISGSGRKVYVDRSLCN